MNTTFALSLLVSLACVAEVTQAQALAGNPASAERKIAQCSACHGTAGPPLGAALGLVGAQARTQAVPMLAGQGEVYLALALSAYRLGDRKHPGMRAIARELSDQDIADFAAYYAQASAGASAAPERSVAPPAAVRPLPLPKGLRQTLSGCTSCHGVDFVHGPDPAYPRLAGQHPGYLLSALQAYRHEQQPLLGRKHAAMNAIARSLDGRELGQIAEFIGSLPGPLSMLPIVAPAPAAPASAARAVPPSR